MALGIALGLAGLGSTYLGIKQQKQQIRRAKQEKKRNDITTQTRFANAAQRADMAKAGFEAEARVAREEAEIVSMQEEGAARVASAVTGITGISVENTLVGIKRDRGKAFASIDEQIEDNINEIDMQMQSNFESMQDALASGQVVDMTSDFANALNMLSAGMSGYIIGGGLTPKAAPQPLANLRRGPRGH